MDKQRTLINMTIMTQQNLWISFKSLMMATDFCHPDYLLNIYNWHKYRVTYEGGEEFKDEYLKTFSTRENPTDFATRRELAYVPAFASAAIDDIANAIFQRISDVIRIGESGTYAHCCAGELGGMDENGTSMNAMIGQTILKNILVTRRVGLYIDMPSEVGPTLATSTSAHPYTYCYLSEDILNWSYDKQTLTSVVLRDTEYTFDGHGVPNGYKYTIRFLQLEKADAKGTGGVRVSFWDENFKVQTSEIFLSGLDEIPFVIFDIGQSLMARVADYQIALMNIASSASSFLCNSNFPFYTEQYDPKNRNAASIKQMIDETTGEIVEDTKAPSVEVGALKGRLYPTNTERPQFISPSTAPLEISLAYQKQLKAEIRSLVNLSVASLDSTVASAESKAQDNQGLEAGLSYIGLVLQKGENSAARIWAKYEHVEQTVIKYPTNYSIKSNKDRYEEAKALFELLPATPSLEYRKQMVKSIAFILLGHKIDYSTLMVVFDQIDEKDVILTTLDDAIKAKNAMLLCNETIATAFDYPIDKLEKAMEEHVKMLEMVIQAQTKNSATGIKDPAARGVKELSTDISTDIKNDNNKKEQL
jgi:hypothetical protein